MVICRFIRLMVHVVSGVCVCAFFYGRLSIQEREARIQRWSRKLLEICRVEFRVYGEIEEGVLVVSNHVSWLDIYTIHTQRPCRFVAKASIRNWPVIGWLSDKTGTIFLERTSARDLRRIFQELVAEINAGARFAFFPEGTTSQQDSLLPFNANLFQAAIDAQIKVQPYAVRYIKPNGELHPQVGFEDGMNLFQAVIAVLKSDAVVVELNLLLAIETTGQHRRDLARITHEIIAKALDVALDAADNPHEITSDQPVAKL